MNRELHLKIKILSLAEEARIIRKEANKLSGIEKWHLNAHRTGIVRSEARHSLLAYSILRGMPYSKQESIVCQGNHPNLTKVAEMAKRFGADEESIKLWIEEAIIHLKKE